MRSGSQYDANSAYIHFPDSVLCWDVGDWNEGGQDSVDLACMHGCSTEGLDL